MVRLADAVGSKGVNKPLVHLLASFRRQHVCSANTEIFCAQPANFVSAPPSFGHRNRTRATRADAAVPLEISGQYGLRPPPSDGTDSMGDVEFPQRCPPPDQERTPVRSGQRSLAGVAPPRHLAAGKAQVRQRSVRCTVLQHSAHFTVMHAWCNVFAGLAIHVYFTFGHAPSFALYSLWQDWYHRCKSVRRSFLNGHTHRVDESISVVSVGYARSKSTIETQRSRYCHSVLCRL